MCACSSSCTCATVHLRIPCEETCSLNCESRPRVLDFFDVCLVHLLWISIAAPWQAVQLHVAAESVSLHRTASSTTLLFTFSTSHLKACQARQTPASGTPNGDANDRTSSLSAWVSCTTCFQDLWCHCTMTSFSCKCSRLSVSCTHSASAPD